MQGEYMQGEYKQSSKYIYNVRQNIPVISITKKTLQDIKNLNGKINKIINSDSNKVDSKKKFPGNVIEIIKEQIYKNGLINKLLIELVILNKIIDKDNLPPYSEGKIISGSFGKTIIGDHYVIKLPHNTTTPPDIEEEINNLIQINKINAIIKNTEIANGKDPYEKCSFFGEFPGIECIINLNGPDSVNDTVWKYPPIIIMKSAGVQLKSAQNINMDLKHVFQIFYSLASSLDCLHKSNVLHGDIKPENITIMELDVDGIFKFPKIIDNTFNNNSIKATFVDFGISLINPNICTNTDTIGIGGTLEYVSKEQLHGAPNCRSDIYSLGIVMCELIFNYIITKYTVIKSNVNQNAFVTLYNTKIYAFKNAHANDVAEIFDKFTKGVFKLLTELIQNSVTDEEDKNILNKLFGHTKDPGLIRQMIDNDYKKRPSALGQLRVDIDRVGVVEQILGFVKDDNFKFMEQTPVFLRKKLHNSKVKQLEECKRLTKKIRRTPDEEDNYKHCVQSSTFVRAQIGEQKMRQQKASAYIKGNNLGKILELYGIDSVEYIQARREIKKLKNAPNPIFSTQEMQPPQVTNVKSKSFKNRLLSKIRLKRGGKRKKNKSRKRRKKKTYRRSVKKDTNQYIKRNKKLRRTRRISKRTRRK